MQVYNISCISKDIRERTSESLGAKTEAKGCVDERKNMRLKVARMEAGLSQAQLAELVGATRQTIGLIEAGRYNPSLKLCIGICKTLGKTLDDLFWNEENARRTT